MYLSQKKKTLFTKVLIVLAGCSFLVAMLEGFFYYEGYASHPFMYFLLMLQNAIKAFSFRATVSLDGALNRLSENATVLHLCVTYAYGLAMFIAPFCTIGFF